MMRPSTVHAVLILAGAAAADSLDALPKPYWKPLHLAKRNATVVSPSEYLPLTPSTSAVTSSSITSTLFSSPQPTLSSITSDSLPTFSYVPATTAPTPVAPVGTASSLTYIPGSNSSSVQGSGTAAPAPVCTGATLNVLGASLDWWYVQTYTHVATTLIVEFDENDQQTGWSAQPATASFNVTSALAAPTCSPVITYDPTASQTVTGEMCASTAPPVAAGTTVVQQSAFQSLTVTRGTGTSLPDVVITPAPAAVTIPSSGGNFSAGTPFVFFSRYQIMSKAPTTYNNGSVGCAETTSVYNMSSPFSFEFTGGDVNGSVEVNAGVTGDVAPAFLGVVSITDAIAGSWVAEPTVVVVVKEVVAAQAVLAAHTEISASTLATPTPTLTLPPGISTIKSTPTAPGIYYSPRIESTQASLIVPTAIPDVDTDTASSTVPARAQTFVAHIEDQDTTLIVPAPTGAQYITTTIDGQKVTATAIGDVQATAGNGGLGPLLTAIQSAAKPATPTNAFDVLTAALGSTRNPTAGAIVDGIGGGSQMQPPQIVTPAPAVTIGNTAYQPNAGSTYNIGSQLLTPGGQITVSGTTISLAMDGSSAVVNGATQTVGSGGSGGNSHATITAPAVLTVGGQPIAPNGGTTYMILGQTLTPGGAVTFSAAGGMETVSLNSAANQLVTVQNGVTATSNIGAAAAAPSAPALTIDGAVFPAAINNPGSGATYVIAGQTLTPGGAITLAGANGFETVSLMAGGTAIVDIKSGKTTTSTLPGAAGAKATSPPVLTIGGQTFTAMNSGGTYVVAGSTLTPGGIATVTISGQVYIVSMVPNASVLEIEMVGANGKVTATSYETLLPVGATGGGTVYSTLAGGATASGGASATASSSSSSGGPAAQLGGSGQRFALQVTGTLVAVSSLALAIWL